MDDNLNKDFVELTAELSATINDTMVNLKTCSYRLEDTSWYLELTYSFTLDSIQQDCIRKARDYVIDTITFEDGDLSVGFKNIKINQLTQTATSLNQEGAKTTVEIKITANAKEKYMKWK